MGSEGGTGKEEPSLKDKMLPTWEGSERQGDTAGKQLQQGFREMGGGK